MLRCGRYDQPATSLYRMTRNEDISNLFEITERKRLAVQNNVDNNKYLTIIFFSQHYTQLDTCPKFHPHICNSHD